MIAVYGTPPAELAEVPAGAEQTSPLIPDSADLVGFADASLDQAVILAPPGAAERRYVLAQTLRSLKVGAGLVVLAPKDRGGSRLGKELTAFGCEVIESGKRHHRICVTRRPKIIPGLDVALAEGAPREVPGLGWTQPGVFSWDRIDRGTALLLKLLPPLIGEGADFGVGIGLLASQVLASPAVTGLTLVDIDGRAVACARRNITDPRAAFVWADVRTAPLAGLDFVVMNPPFHDGGAEDRRLGQAFIASAAQSLRAGGVCWLVANRHLPYERPLSEHFKTVRLAHEGDGYKVYEARK